MIVPLRPRSCSLPLLVGGGAVYWEMCSSGHRPPMDPSSAGEVTQLPCLLPAAHRAFLASVSLRN